MLYSFRARGVYDSAVPEAQLDLTVAKRSAPKIFMETFCLKHLRSVRLLKIKAKQNPKRKCGFLLSFMTVFFSLSN